MQKICHFSIAFQKGLGHIAPVAASDPRFSELPRTGGYMSGCSSGVEHNLAKVGVERSNRFTRSIFYLEKIRLHQIVLDDFLTGHKLLILFSESPI
jgi:hypothetical protein